MLKKFCSDKINTTKSSLFFLSQFRDYMKMNFEYLQIQKLMLQTVREEKVDEINGVICLVSMFPS